MGNTRTLREIIAELKKEKKELMTFKRTHLIEILEKALKEITA